MGRFIYWLFAGLIIISCSGGDSFVKHELMPGSNWNRFRTVWVDYDATSLKRKFDLYIVVRYDARCLSRELDIMGTIHTPSGEMRYQEYEIGLRGSDEVIIGKKISGEGDNAVYEQRYLFREDYQFADEGRYRFEIENLMPNYDNPGIVSVGISVEPSER